MVSLAWPLVVLVAVLLAAWLVYREQEESGAADAKATADRALKMAEAALEDSSARTVSELEQRIEKLEGELSLIRGMG